MKIFINKPKEDWVVDRFVNEWNKYNFKSSYSYLNSNVIWLIAPWIWNKIPKSFLKTQKVLCTIHHIDEDKFDNSEERNFYTRDKYIDLYHVISKKTFSQVNKLTSKPIVNFPFWVNQNIWFEINNKELIFQKYKLSSNKYYVGSFQRDTEGKDLKSPKLSKGPDRFLQIVKQIREEKGNDLVVILTGKRRDYLINNFKKEKINFKYFEMVSVKEINELYNILNLYIVSSRYEGGPQSILECASTKTPLISTDVGIASEILHPSSIFYSEQYKKATPNVEYAYNNITKYFIPSGFEKFNKSIENLYES